MSFLASAGSGHLGLPCRAARRPTRSQTQRRPRSVAFAESVLLFGVMMPAKSFCGVIKACLLSFCTRAQSSLKSSWHSQVTHCATAEDNNAEGDEKNNPEPSGPYSPWPAMEMLKLSATYRHTEPHYLAFKERDKWWSSSKFPRIPHDEPEDVRIKEEPVRLYSKVIPLAIIFFLSSFNLTILAALKDAIVVTTSGAEALPFLAALVVLPASVAFFAYYTKMLNVLPRRQVYYAAVAPFVAFYAIFAAFIYPMSESLHLHGLFEKVSPHIVPGLHGLIKVVENWTYSLFFCTAELWGSVVIAVLFWTLANDVCTVKEAKTVYPMMGISANIALVVAGNFVKYMSTTVLKGASTQTFLQVMVAAIVCCSALMVSVKLWVDKKVMPADSALPPPKQKKKKGSLRQSLATLRESPKIMNLALLVVCYAVSHRLFEFAWKGQLRVLFPTAQQYSGALADVSIYTGYMTILLMLSGKFVFEYLGWGTAALATPTVMFLAGAGFFGLSLAAMHLGVDASTALLTGGTLAGACTQVFARSSKFSLFDPAKEMVYIEMDKEEKSKGKAAVDLMGSQAGKTGASGIISASLLAFGTATACLPAIATMYAVVIAVWARAALRLKGLMVETEAERAEKRRAKEAIEEEDGGAAEGPAGGDVGGGSGNGAGVSTSKPLAA